MTLRYPLGAVAPLSSSAGRRRRFSAGLLAATVSALAPGVAEAAPRPLTTALVDPAVFAGPDGAEGLTRAKAAGATAIKVPLFWDTVAPAAKPRRFKPTDPSDPAYDWTGIDAQLRLVRAHGLEPIVYVSGPPLWARLRPGLDGLLRPDPTEFRAFTLAAVRRYDGQRGLPRVRYWQAWNEPNKVPNRGYRPGAGAWYRAADTSKALEPDNFAVPGSEYRMQGTQYGLPGRSLAIFVAK